MSVRPWIISLLFIAMLWFPRGVSAVGEFTTTLDSRYVVDPQGIVQVKNVVRIKNNYSTMYSSQFAFEVGSEDIRNIQVQDGNGTSLVPNVVHTERKTSISVSFPDKLVGKDKARDIVITYEHPDVSVMAGTVLEVDIPKLSDSSAFSEYQLSVSIPERFGEPAAVSPAQFQKTNSGGFGEYVFGNEAKNGVNILFGEQQSFRFSLRYNIKNPSVSQGIAQVALPPDTAYQRVRFDSIDPMPESIEKDGDGNWIATFHLSGQKEQTVEATGIVSVFLHPNDQISMAKPDARWTSSTPYWQAQDAEVIALAKKLQTPKAIYQYVVNTLEYDYSRFQRGEAERRGALLTLKNPSAALCQDFSDLFVALSRAAGIPARVLTGFAYTDNPRLRPTSLDGDLLHAWPEYYDKEKQRWIPVDPTWQVTTDGVDYFSKLDFHHVVFAIRGLSDSTPFPAGMYKLPGQAGKDVQMEAVPEQPVSNMRLRLQAPDFPVRASVTIRNEGGSAWYNIPVLATTADEASSVEVDPPEVSILPYGSSSVKVHAYRANSFSQEGSVRVSVSVGTENVEYDQAIEQTIHPILLAIGGGILVFAITAGSVLVFRRKRNRSLRR